MYRWPALLLTVTFGALAACQVTAKEHCEARQKLWERAFGDEDPAWTQKTREAFVPACTRNLSKPEAREELECRHRCLKAASRSTRRGSEEAKAEYASFQRCEARCLARDTGSQGP